MKKHDAFEKDFEVHKDRVKDIENVGQGLLAEVRFLCNDIRYLWLYFVVMTLFCFSLQDNHEKDLIEQKIYSLNVSLFLRKFGPNGTLDDTYEWYSPPNFNSFRSISS